MKLFKSLLVAPAALGLLSPLSVSASEVNLNEISNYSDVESKKIVNSFSNDDSNNETLLAGGEGLVDTHDGGFSSTTTASFSTNMYLGFEDTAATAGDDAVVAAYDIQIDLSTSFTGEDSLDISLDGGNAGVPGIDEFDGNQTTVPTTDVEGLAVDGVTYTFPIGEKTTAFVGFDTDGSQLYTTACVYGGPGNMLDDCGNVNAAFISGEAAVGASYDFGNGLTAAFGAQTEAGTVPGSGVFTEESRDFFGLNAAYTGDNYGISLTYASIENATVTDEDAYTALQAYYTPDGSLPSISVGYEIGDLGGVAANADETASFFVGLTWDEVGPGSAGVALGHSNTAENGDELYQYEAYYEYPVNDSMTITPLIYTLDAAGAADDTTGMMVKTSFSF